MDTDGDRVATAAMKEGSPPSITPEINEEVIWQMNLKERESGPYPEHPGQAGCGYYIRRLDILSWLIKDHGNIDVEWSRDIPPDKAKKKNPYPFSIVIMAYANLGPISNLTSLLELSHAALQHLRQKGFDRILKALAFFVRISANDFLK